MGETQNNNTNNTWKPCAKPVILEEYQMAILNNLIINLCDYKNNIEKSELILLHVSILSITLSSLLWTVLPQKLTKWTDNGNFYWLIPMLKPVLLQWKKSHINHCWVEL